jgi:hypothetical protein
MRNTMRTCAQYGIVGVPIGYSHLDR